MPTDGESSFGLSRPQAHMRYAEFSRFRLASSYPGSLESASPSGLLLNRVEFVLFLLPNPYLQVLHKVVKVVARRSTGGFCETARYEGTGLLPSIDKDESAGTTIASVLLEDRPTRRTATGERIEDQSLSVGDGPQYPS